MRRIAISTLTTFLLMAGCTSSSDSEGSTGDDDSESGSESGSSSPSSSPTSAVPSGPDCADIWKAGETLPADYDVCVTDGAAGSQDVVPCDDGTKLVAYLDSFYAVTGGTIVEPDTAPMQDTAEYGAVYSQCTSD